MAATRPGDYPLTVPPTSDNPPAPAGSPRAAGPGAGRLRAALPSAIVAIATGIVLVALAGLAFFNMAWVGFEQERARADLWTGWPAAEVRRVTDAVVSEIYLGPGTFAQVVDGEPVFNPRERGHMADVRTAWLAFLALAAVAAIVLAVAWARARDRARFWRAVAAGAAVLAVGTIAVGISFALLFDTAFELFHRLFFAQGSYTFDPRSERLVQLFPYQFWTESTVAIALVVLALAAVAWAGARGRARRAEAAG
jgi:integral membrane protein (TIGR01906 family)